MKINQLKIRKITNNWKSSRKIGSLEAAADVKNDINKMRRPISEEGPNDVSHLAFVQFWVIFCIEIWTLSSEISRELAKTLTGNIVGNCPNLALLLICKDKVDPLRSYGIYCIFT